MVQEIQAKLKGIETVSDISGYLTGFLRCYGIPNATLARLGLDNSVPVDQSINIGNKLLCTYTKAANLYARYDQIQRKVVKNTKYRFVLLINDDRVRIMV